MEKTPQIFRNPKPTVDIIIELKTGIVLIERRNEPWGWALPGGFVDEGETIEAAAIREAKEETGLTVALTDLLYVYSNPERDQRQHTISSVFIARVDGNAEGVLKAGDDAKNAGIFNPDNLPKLAFDHHEILSDYFSWKETGKKPNPSAKFRMYSNKKLNSPI